MSNDIAARRDSLAICAEGLRKEYGSNVAVEDLHLAVERGEVFGFLGPNGAGKTTSLKMLLGLARPTSGAAWVLGQSPSDWHVRARIGFLPEHFRFQEWLRASEFLEIHGRLYGMDAAAIRRRVPELLALVGLTRHAQKPLGDFSKGMLQRIGLAQALLNHPDLVFLDEPTSGLDPLGRRLVRDIIHSLRDQGITVFLNSHLLSEVEITCDRVAFIRRGQVVQTGRLNDLLAGGTEVELRLGAVTPELLGGLEQFGKRVGGPGSGVAGGEPHPDVHPHPDPLPERARGIESTGARGQESSEKARGQESTGEKGGVTVTLRLASDDDVPKVVAWLAARGVGIYSVVPRRLSLEEVFMHVMEGEEAG